MQTAYAVVAGCALVDAVCICDLSAPHDAEADTLKDTDRFVSCSICFL